MVSILLKHIVAGPIIMPNGPSRARIPLTSHIGPGGEQEMLVSEREIF
jgi:hypothetical protein